MKKKVLLIDDDFALCCVLILALQEAGCKVHYQTSVIGALSVVQSLQPDIIILDVEVGEKNGIDTFEALKPVISQIPVLFISSHTDAEYVKRAINAGGVAYLKKPFSPDELIAYVNRFTNSEKETTIPFGHSSINWNTRALITPEDRHIRLTPLETRLLKLLLSNLNEVVLREQLEGALPEEGSSVSAGQTLNNYIARLRKYLDADTSITIKTIPRRGYQLLINTSI